MGDFQFKWPMARVFCAGDNARDERKVKGPR